MLTVCTEACRGFDIDGPVFQIVSDRRGKSWASAFSPSASSYLAQSFVVVADDVCLLCGALGGRTAWSSGVTVRGCSFSARFWYDDRNLSNAKEDAAEMALNWLNSSSGSGW